MTFDLIVVGAGLAGAAFAAALRGSRLRIALVEAMPPRREGGWDSRIYAYSPENAAFLRELGVWQHLDLARLSPVHRMKIHGDRFGTLDFSAYQSGLSELAWIGEAGLVQQELWEGLKRQHNVTLFCPAAPVSLKVGAEFVSVNLADGRTLSARLLVGADGRDSWVRGQAGICVYVIPYDEIGIVANFRCEREHRQNAWQWFRGDGVLAWLPLPGKMISMVWSAPTDFAERLLALDEKTFCDVVADAGGGALGALSLHTPRADFPLRLMRVQEAVRPRIALIGDAAHAIHPLSGHGINLGFQDARALAAQIAAQPEWQDPGDLAVLRAYARERSEEPFLLQYATHGLNRLFANRSAPAALLRNAGLNLVNRIPVVKNALIRYATSGRF